MIMPSIDSNSSLIVRYNFRFSTVAFQNAFTPEEIIFSLVTDWKINLAVTCFGRLRKRRMENLEKATEVEMEWEWKMEKKQTWIESK